MTHVDIAHGQLTFKMSSPHKRKSEGNRSGSSGPKKKPKIPHIPDEEALGVFPIHHTYKTYSILNKIVKDKKTNEVIELKNKEKPREMLAILDMGNNFNIEAMSDKEVINAINELFDRDQALLKCLLNGEIKVENFGTLLFPEIFFTKVPMALNLDPVGWNHKKNAAIQNTIPFPKVDVGNLTGDFWERPLYTALKNYFEDTKNACLILHGHSFLHQDHFREKDFIILNLSKGYIMGIEVKGSHKQFDHAKEQVKDCRNRIQAVFNGIEGMSSLWKFVGVCFIGNRHEQISGKEFVIDGTEDIAAKLNKIEHQVQTPLWTPNEDRVKEFVNVAKFILFEAQGHHKAPLTKQVLIEKVDKDLEKASAPENILFWTPEQLSIVQAMDNKWMLLMSYYGCGKTILLIERAEYLLRNQDHMVHFYVDNVNSGLTEVLKRRFANHRNIKIRTKRRNDDYHWLFDGDGVLHGDHVIIDEAYVKDSKRFLNYVKLLQSVFSTVWVSIGAVGINDDSVDFHNFTESEFRKGLEDLSFTCPTLTHCLRNGQKVVEFAKENHDDDIKIEGLHHFANQVEVKANVNDGLLYEMPLVYPNPIKALEEIFRVHNFRKTFIVVDYNFSDRTTSFEMSTLKEAIPDHDFVSFRNKEAREEWFESNNMNQHLVLNGYKLDDPEVSGMEFQSMIYLSSTCSKCGFAYKDSRIVTRAKASLHLTKYEKDELTPCMGNPRIGECLGVTKEQRNKRNYVIMKIVEQNFKDEPVEIDAEHYSLFQHMYADMLFHRNRSME